MSKNLALSTAKRRLRSYETQLQAKAQQIEQIKRIVMLARANAETTKDRNVINLCGQIERILFGMPSPGYQPEPSSALSRFRRWLGFDDTQPVATMLERDVPGVPESVLLPKNSVPEPQNGVFLGSQNVPGVPESVPEPPKNVLLSRTFASERTKTASMALFERNCVSAIAGYMNEAEIEGYISGATIAPQAILFQIDLKKSGQRRQFKAGDLALWLGVDDSEVSIGNRLGQLFCIVALPDELKRGVLTADLPTGAIGLDLDNVPLSLPFSLSNNALFIVGQQGCGKTTLIETIMYSLIASHRGRCEMLIIDHRDEFEPFDSVDVLVRPRVSDHSQVNDALEAVVRNAPKRGKNSAPLYVIIDEVVELITDYGLDVTWLTKVANQRRYGVFIIAATQQLEGDVYGFSKYATMKIAGNLSGADVSGRVLGKGIDAHLLQPPADFILAQSGRKTRFRGALTDKQLIAQLPRSATPKPQIIAPEVKPTKDNSNMIASVDIDVEMNMTGREAPDFYIPVYLAAELAYLNGETDQKSLAQAAKHFGIGKDKARMHRDFARRIQATYKNILESDA